MKTMQGESAQDTWSPKGERRAGASQTQTQDELTAGAVSRDGLLRKVPKEGAVRARVAALAQ